MREAQQEMAMGRSICVSRMLERQVLTRQQLCSKRPSCEHLIIHPANLRHDIAPFLPGWSGVGLIAIPTKVN
jgi:hypothetical protein